MRLHQVPVPVEGSMGALGRAPPTPPSCIKLPRRQPALGLAPASRASSHSRPQQLSSSVLVTAAATGREASTSTNGSHASSLSPEAAKEGMQWLAKWVSSQYMGMGKSAEDAMPELRRRGVVCSDASNGQVLFRVPGHEEPLDGPSVIRLLNLKARPGIKQTEPQPPSGLVRSTPPSRASSEAPDHSGGESPRSTSPSHEYQVGRLPDSPDAAAMRWLAEWIAAHYSGLGKQAEDVLPELRRRGVVYSSIKDGRVMFRVPGVTSRVEAPQIIQMLRLQPRPGMKPSEPKPPQSLFNMLTSNNKDDASPMVSQASSPSSSRSSSPNRYSSPGKTRASSSLSPEAATLGMRWLAIFVSSQYLGMGRSAEDALPELRAMGVVCSSVRDGRPMFIVPGHPEEVDAPDVVKMLRLQLRPGVRPRAPTPPPALKGNGSSSTQTLDMPAPSSERPAAPAAEKPAEYSVEDGIRYLAAWVSQNYSGMGKTVEDVLPELRRQGVVCSSVIGSTPLYRMRGQKEELNAASVIKALRLQARPGVDPSKPTPPAGLKLGAPIPPRTPTPAASPQRPSSAAKAAPSAPAPTSARPPAPKAQAQPAAAAPSAGKKEAGQESPPPSAGPKKDVVKDVSESSTAQLVLPATVTLLVAAALGGGSLAIKEISKSGFFNPDRLSQERGLPGNVPQSGSNNVTGGPPYSPVKPRDSMMLQAPPVGQQPSGVQPLDSKQGDLMRAQEQEQRRVEREEMERVQREREMREQMRKELEQQDREMRAQSIRIQEEQARLDREARATEQRQQQERAQQEQQQREQERRDREQREREQKERAQKEKEDRERAQREERERAQREKERAEQEQRARDQQKMEAETSPPEQPKGLLGQKPTGVQPLPGRQTQPLQPPNQARGAESKGGVQPKTSPDAPAEPRGAVVPLSEAGKQETRAPEPPYEPPAQAKGLLETPGGVQPKSAGDPPSLAAPQPMPQMPPPPSLTDRREPKPVQPSQIEPPIQARGLELENKGGVQPKPPPPPIDPNAPKGVQPMPGKQRQEPQSPQGSNEPPNQPKGVPPMAAMMPEDPAQAAAKESRDKWGSRANVEKVEGDKGDQEEDLAKKAPTLSNPSTRAGGLTQDQIEGYEACLFRSIGC